MKSSPPLAQVPVIRRSSEIERQACAKPQKRVTERFQAVKEDKAGLETWKKEIRARDEMRCRSCRRRVVVALELTANRAECHHLQARNVKALRHDARNGVLLCYLCHEKVTHHELVIVQQKADMFTLEHGGKRYFNGDKPIEFKPQGESVPSADGEPQA